MSTGPVPPAAPESSPIVTVYGTWSMVKVYVSPALVIKPVITNLSTWFSDVNCSKRLRLSIPVTSAPLAAPNISYLIGVISTPTHRLWLVVVGSEILVNLEESGIIIVLEIDSPPHP